MKTSYTFEPPAKKKSLYEFLNKIGRSLPKEIKDKVIKLVPESQRKEDVSFYIHTFFPKYEGGFNDVSVKAVKVTDILDRSTPDAYLDAIKKFGGIRKVDFYFHKIGERKDRTQMYHIDAKLQEDQINEITSEISIDLPKNALLPQELAFKSFFEGRYLPKVLEYLGINYEKSEKGLIIPQHQEIILTPMVQSEAFKWILDISLENLLDIELDSIGTDWYTTISDIRNLENWYRECTVEIGSENMSDISTISFEARVNKIQKFFEENYGIDFNKKLIIKNE